VKIVFKDDTVVLRPGRICWTPGPRYAANVTRYASRVTTSYVTRQPSHTSRC